MNEIEVKAKDLSKTVVFLMDKVARHVGNVFTRFDKVLPRAIGNECFNEFCQEVALVTAIIINELDDDIHVMERFRHAYPLALKFVDVFGVSHGRIHGMDIDDKVIEWIKR